MRMESSFRAKIHDRGGAPARGKAGLRHKVEIYPLRPGTYGTTTLMLVDVPMIRFVLPGMKLAATVYG